jgi:hypothetical protein
MSTPSPTTAGTVTNTVSSEGSETDPNTAKHKARQGSAADASLTDVSISGPASGMVDVSYAFSAIVTVSPITATLQITYVWQTTGQMPPASPVTHTGGLSDTVSFIWDIAGTHTITVTATNGAGMVINTHAIAIDAPPTGTSTPTSTPTPTATRTPTPTPRPPDIDDVEPDWFVNTQPIQITILGSRFQSGAIVRAKDFGLLSSEWINDSLLTAIVPAGLAKGKYDVKVTNPDGRSDTRRNAFEVATPTRTPTITPEPTSTSIPTSTREPTSTPEPTPTPFKRPLLFIASSSTNPSSVAPDESVIVTVRIKNIGDTSADNIRISFASDIFVPTGTSATQAIAKLGSDAETAVDQSLVLSGEASTGVYQQQVDLQYEDPRGVSYSSTEVVGVSITVPEPGLPRIVIRDAQAIPDPIVPGQPFTLTFGLHNAGDGIAEDVLVSVGESGPALPIAAGSTQSVGTLYDEETIELLQRLIISESISKGSYSQAISIQYQDGEGNSHTTEERVGLTVAELEDESASRPRLTITSYRSEPSSLIPGEMFNLFVDLLNVGETPALDTRLSLGGGRLAEDLSGGGAASNPAPFAPLDSSNVKFVPYLGPQEGASIMQRMIVDGQSESGAYVLDVTFGYRDEHGVNYTAGELVSLLVIRQPHLQIELYRPVTEVITGELFAIPVEVINVGQETANVNTMELRSLDLEIGDGTVYVGPLDPGTSGLLEAQAVAHRSGEAVAQVIINYLDDFGHGQQVIQELRFQVRSLPTPEGVEAEGEMFGTMPQFEEELSFVDKMGRLFKAVLGLGVG